MNKRFNSYLGWGAASELHSGDTVDIPDILPVLTGNTALSDTVTTELKPVFEDSPATPDLDE